MLANLDPSTIKSELTSAAARLQECGLMNGAKWAAELAVGMRVNNDSVITTPPVRDDLYVLGKCYFDSREYTRAARVLSKCQSCPSGRFLGAYSLYLAGEKRKFEDEEAGDVPVPRNSEVAGIVQTLSTMKDATGFEMYLLGIVLRAHHGAGGREAAKTAFLRSVEMEPCNWEAWKELAALCTDMSEIQALKVPEHWMMHFFWGHAALRWQRNEDARNRFQSLLPTFPASTYILEQIATACYNDRDFAPAEAIFERLLKSDPQRLDGMDTYSNILYVKEERVKLSSLAHIAVEVDKYRPVTCCIVGNYFSLRGEHEKAVLYFKRAVRLDPRFLSAWTLMGHEYVELRNTRAAIDAYRHAVDMSPVDYRAWYGLGQTYEILQMPQYALYYYRQACAIRPYDARMWCALAGCYEALMRVGDAIKCYERAESNKDAELIAVNKLAKIYQGMDGKEDDKAAYYFKKSLSRRDAQGIGGQDTIEALLYLANHCVKIGRLEDGEVYASRLLDFGGPERDESRAILREIHSKQAM